MRQRNFITVEELKTNLGGEFGKMLEARLQSGEGPDRVYLPLHVGATRKHEAVEYPIYREAEFVRGEVVADNGSVVLSWTLVTPLIVAAAR